MDRLTVKNFGPLKDIDIELNKINLFIGENGSGKSVLGKLITVLYNIVDNIESKKEGIIEELSKYNINYITNETLIQLKFYDNNDEPQNIITIKDDEIQLGEIFNVLKSSFTEFKEAEKTFYENKQQLLEHEKRLKKIKEHKENIEIILKEIEKVENDIKKMSTDFLTNEKLIKNTKELFNRFQTKYIPSERNFVSIISQSLSSFIVAEIPLPKFFLQFSSDFENAANKIKELNVLNIHYKYSEGLDRHKVYFDEKNYLPLNESSSGIQAVIPLLVTYKYFTDKYYTIVIEEPEQNLFPKAQAEIIKYIIEKKTDNNNLFMMTHSPYVLSTLNNLIFAFKVAQMSEETKEKVKDLIKEEQWINPDEFSAYFLENGVAKSIISKRGLISDNAIDDISEDVIGEFDDLMQIYRDFKYAK